jgi:hypothetical protein
MCKVYNSLGSLMAIKAHLRGHNVNDFKSVNELVNFQKNNPALRQEIISNHLILIERERDHLSEEIAQLTSSITTRKSEAEQKLQLELNELGEQLERLISTRPSIFKVLIDYAKKARLKKRIRDLRFNFNAEIEHSANDLTSMLTRKTNRYQFII